MANKNINGDVNVSFTEAQSRQSLESGESVKTLFGKLRKWLSDLKPVAFSGSYNDLDNKPSIPTTSAGITAMTGYTKPQATSAITASDTLNQAIGKLEKGLESAGSEKIPLIFVNGISQNKSTIKYVTIGIDDDIIDTNPIFFTLFGGGVFSATPSYIPYSLSFDSVIFADPFSSNRKMVMSDGIRNAVSYNYSILDKQEDYKNTHEINIYIYSTGTNISTYIIGIKPVDFTAVKYIKYDGRTLWERT